MRESTVESPVIVALDYASMNDALTFADSVDPKRCRMKVGKEMFTRFGPQIVTALHNRGFEVFLDLKFHDIPNTVASAIKAAADLGVWMVNVHALGGAKMLAAASEAVQNMAHKPLLIGVTVLTSMDAQQLTSLGIQESPEALVSRLAKSCAEHGLDGVVCSAQEASELRKISPEHFCLVTPGIRPEAASNDDQIRVMTPAQAIKAGSNYLVIGRPITKASDPQAALGSILASLKP